MFFGWRHAGVEEEPSLWFRSIGTGSGGTRDENISFADVGSAVPGNFATDCGEWCLEPGILFPTKTANE